MPGHCPYWGQGNCPGVSSVSGSCAAMSVTAVAMASVDMPLIFFLLPAAGKNPTREWVCGVANGRQSLYDG